MLFQDYLFLNTALYVSFKKKEGKKNWGQDTVGKFRMLIDECAQN